MYVGGKRLSQVVSAQRRVDLDHNELFYCKTAAIIEKFTLKYEVFNALVAFQMFRVQSICPF